MWGRAQLGIQTPDGKSKLGPGGDLSARQNSVASPNHDQHVYIYLYLYLYLVSVCVCIDFDFTTEDRADLVGRILSALGAGLWLQSPRETRGVAGCSWLPMKRTCF